MKLYTEEQVIALTKAAFTSGLNHNPFIFSEEFKNITPIDLPSNEEIYINANVNSENVDHHYAVIKGIQITKELIQGGNK